MLVDPGTDYAHVDIDRKKVAFPFKAEVEREVFKRSANSMLQTFANLKRFMENWLHCVRIQWL